MRKEWVNTMEKYETLEMEIIFFEGEDVITDSKDDIVTGEQGMTDCRPVRRARGGNAVFLPLFVFVLFWSRTDAPDAYAEASDTIKRRRRNCRNAAGKRAEGTSFLPHFYHKSGRKYAGFYGRGAFCAGVKSE